MLKTVMLLNIIGNYDNFFFFLMNRKLKRIAGIFSDIINVCIAFDQIVTSMLKKNITFFLSFRKPKLSNNSFYLCQGSNPAN